MKYVSISLLIFCSAVCANAQLLVPGMAVMTFMPEDTATDYVVHIYDTRNVISVAPTGTNWSMNTLLPANNADALQWKASRMGAVFGVTIDAAGNIYVSSGNVYSYSLAFGSLPGTAGNGGIYRINANDWSVTDFVTTDPNPTSSSTTQLPNTGPGLGNIAYDKWNDQLFVTNFEDGKIYRIGINGTVLGSFDPFTADNGQAGIAAAGDRPWGIGVYQDNSGETRVYFGNWTTDLGTLSFQPAPFDKNSIWSVALDANGNFTGTERLEIAIPADPSPLSGTFVSPPSCINFSSSGKMLIAERSMMGSTQVGAHYSRWMEYEKTGNAWASLHVYNVGNVDWARGLCAGGAGGADYGYADSDASESVNGCEEMIWGTGDAIRYSIYNPDGGTDKVYGLAGVPETGNSNDPNSPVFVSTSSYMIDANNTTTDIPKTNMGSAAVFRTCEYDPCEKYVCTLINVVTPNEDAVNDFFTIDCIHSEGWGLEVFNRWGEKMYASTSYANDWNCAGLNEGVYYYILKTPCEEGKTMTGFFHLLRAKSN